MAQADFSGVQRALETILGIQRFERQQKLSEEEAKALAAYRAETLGLSKEEATRQADITERRFSKIEEPEETRAAEAFGTAKEEKTKERARAEEERLLDIMAEGIASPGKAAPMREADILEILKFDPALGRATARGEQLKEERRLKRIDVESQAALRRASEKSALALAEKREDVDPFVAFSTGMQEAYVDQAKTGDITDKDAVNAINNEAADWAFITAGLKSKDKAKQTEARTALLTKLGRIQEKKVDAPPKSDKGFLDWLTELLAPTEGVPISPKGTTKPFAPQLAQPDFLEQLTTEHAEKIRGKTFAPGKSIR